MRYDYSNDNDIPAARALNDEDRAVMEALSRFDEIMDYVGEVPANGSHFLYQ